jgi:uncharacterized LabA/DUF88 family protein
MSVFRGVNLAKSSIVYVDGFNLYYGLLRPKAYKWFDLVRCFTSIRQDDSIQKIKYFTAKVTGSPSYNRQDVYLKALSTSPLIEIVYGVFKHKDIYCKVSSCSSSHRKYSTYEEKRTDVNIAVHMLQDAYKNNCERIVLVSGDSDLVPSLEFIKRDFHSIETIVYIPAVNKKRGAAVELRTAADKNFTFGFNYIQPFLLSDPVISPSGNTFAKPSGW